MLASLLGLARFFARILAMHGSDTQTWWAFGLYAISSVLVGTLLSHRISLARNKKRVALRKEVPLQSVSNVRTIK